jgi:hypothetical protein
MVIETEKFANTSNNNRMYREQIITREDLNEFRSLLLKDLNEIIQSKTQQTKQWLKSNEVRKLLNISPGTLQNLRINGTLSYTKIGGIMYYDNSDIDKLLNKNKVNIHL